MFTLFLVIFVNVLGFGLIIPLLLLMVSRQAQRKKDPDPLQIAPRIGIFTVVDGLAFDR